jgi:hypothetical protein
LGARAGILRELSAAAATAIGWRPDIGFANVCGSEVRDIHVTAGVPDRKRNGIVRFSERMGLVAPKVDIQFDETDDVLRVAIWNALQRGTLRTTTVQWIGLEPFRHFYSTLWERFFHRPVDTIPSNSDQAREAVRQWFFGTATWQDVYDFWSSQPFVESASI